MTLARHSMAVQIAPKVTISTLYVFRYKDFQRTHVCMLRNIQSRYRDYDIVNIYVYSAPPTPVMDNKFYREINDRFLALNRSNVQIVGQLFNDHVWPFFASKYSRTKFDWSLKNVSCVCHSFSNRCKNFVKSLLILATQGANEILIKMNHRSTEMIFWSFVLTIVWMFKLFGKFVLFLCQIIPNQCSIIKSTNKRSVTYEDVNEKYWFVLWK